MSKDQGVADFFTSLGYEVSYDFSTRTGKVWWEILDQDGGLICQIDKGVELKYIIEDLKCIANGSKVGTSPIDYEICAPESNEFNELLEKVKSYED